MNNTFLNLFDTNIKNIVKQVKIPYRKDGGYKRNITSGSDGLLTKVFLLSTTETGITSTYTTRNEGACLSYFNEDHYSTADPIRIAYINGSACQWWLRSPWCQSNYGNGYMFVTIVNTGGKFDARWAHDTVDVPCVRPALILPLDAKVDANFNVIA